MTYSIDQLTYTYKPNSNRLDLVHDNSNSVNGFRDGNFNGTDYQYDDNGNMIIDRNKGIQTISYNHLNLPVEITFSNDGKISYLYNALGSKIKKSVTMPSQVETTDYLGGFQYKNEVLQYFPTAEGYVNVTDGTFFNYVYNYTDHLGNIRLSYTQSGTELKILEENHYYPFGLKHNNYNTDKVQFKKSEFGTSAVLQFAERNNNQYKYNGKELQVELGLNMYDYGARNYDPALGRWINVDPLADLYESWSPYNYTLNNPIRYIDPDGMMVSDALSGDDVTNNTTPEPEPAPIVLDEVVIVAKKKSSSNLLNWVQTGLDVIGFIPVVGEIADGANALIYLSQGDYVNAGISAIAMIPVVGDLGKGIRLGKKLTNLIDATKGVSGVYEITTKSGKKYIGQSKNVGKRLKQHNSSAKFKSDEIVDVKVTEVKGTDRVDREVFEQRKLNDAGGIDNTLNERNPIGPARANEMSRNVSTGKKFEMN